MNLCAAAALKMSGASVLMAGSLYFGECDGPEQKMSSVDAFVPTASGVQPLLTQLSELTDIRLHVRFTNPP
jgi:hypothetical protein